LSLLGTFFPPIIVRSKTRIHKSLVRKPERIVGSEDSGLDIVDLPVEDSRNMAAIIDEDVIGVEIGMSKNATKQRRIAETP